MIYGYGFSVSDRASNWTFAGPDLGPVIASGWAFYGFFVYATALSSVTLLTVTFYFVILFMWWYSARAKRVRARMLGRGPEIPKEKPPTPRPEPAEKTVKTAAYTCTNCGADVDEADRSARSAGRFSRPERRRMADTFAHLRGEA